MDLSFSQYLAIHEIFRLDYGKVLTLREIFNQEDDSDPAAAAQKRIASVKDKYVPGPYGSDHLTAAVLGYKPCAIVQYQHHESNPAAEVVKDILKIGGSNVGAIQGELLRHGFKVRPDFTVTPLFLPGYMTSMMLVGGKKACEEMKTLYMCQFHLDLISSPEIQSDPDKMAKVPDLVHDKCDAFCDMSGTGGDKCMPLHKRIGQLLGYTDQQVEEFLADMKERGGYDHMPDVKYPVDLPPSLAGVPRKKGFSPNESITRSTRVFRQA